MSGDPTFGVPAPNVALAKGTDSRGIDISATITDLWYRFMVRAVQLTAERPIQQIGHVTSPFEFEATTIGTLVFDSMTGITGISVTRGSITVPVQSAAIPLAAKDIARVTFTGAGPTFNFIPAARA